MEKLKVNSVVWAIDNNRCCHTSWKKFRDVFIKNERPEYSICFIESESKYFASFFSRDGFLWFSPTTKNINLCKSFALPF